MIKIFCMCFLSIYIFNESVNKLYFNYKYRLLKSLKVRYLKALSLKILVNDMLFKKTCRKL